MIVTPSILVDSVDEFWPQVKVLSPYYQHFQVDITDGELFPTPKTVQIDDIVSSLAQNQELIAANLFDFHLMVKDYEAEIKKLAQLRESIKIDTVLVHFSVLPNYQLLATSYSSFKIAIVLNPEDTVS